MKLKARHTFLILSTLFLAYSLSIYLTPLNVEKNTGVDQEMAAEGRLVWQKYNCQSCHQLYGLGGYLGPDLTNVLSAPGKGEGIVKALTRSGTRQMPAFDINDKEMEMLIEFLKSTDASGKSDPRAFQRNNFGMIEQDETN